MQWLARITFLLGLLAAVGLLLTGPAYRMGWWELGFTFRVFFYVVYAAIGATVLGVLALLVRWRSGRGSVVLALLGMVLAGGAASVPVMMRSQASEVPPIHDITTNTMDPPAFVAIAPLRADAPNPVDYAGEETAAKQREAYPDLQTIRIRATVPEVFSQASAAVADLGWEIHAVEEGEGRIEATDTTRWFAFKDDVVIRIVAGNEVTLVDVRSKSRVGMSDIGLNAERIRRFRDALLARLL
ncbi:MAG: DUF1499 domain-containing protein [Pseudomonadota bacterium]